jgi:very-short-patch-repair endonuclease
LGGFSVLNYRADLKAKARDLRSNMTDAEQKLWHQLRRKQILGVQFFRQRPIGEYIVDFHAPMLKPVIELDGSQHQENGAIEYDAVRTAHLESIGLNVMRFNNLQVLSETANVLEVIHQFLHVRQSLPASL